MQQERKPRFWLGSSKANLKAFPGEVQDVMGHALDIAQQGKKYLDAKPLKGFDGAGILEIMDDHAGDTYRVVYTVKFAEAVYVLHACQKKSKRGITTPKQEIHLVKSRLKRAQEHYEEWGKN